MSWLGLVMFVLAGALMVASGLPVYAVLLGVASVFAMLGVALGAFEWRLLTALPARVVGLLEHDLLQALPLYALVGALLHRLPLAEWMQRGAERILRRLAAAPLLAALGVGALLAPMNGSVAASLHLLSRRVGPALRQAGVAQDQALGTICVASTLGVVIPPSLVLILLGDAMMRAHTEAAHANSAIGRIVNTQDIMRAALWPGLTVVLVSLAIVAWQGRHAAPRPAPPPMGRGQALAATVAVVGIAALLSLVAIGRIYAVEAAATGALVLLVAGLVTRRLDRRALGAVVREAMTLTGLLMALLVAATTFSLVVRGFASDALVARGVQSLAATPTLLLAAVLFGLLICSFVLDAFEMIFLVVPLVMPPLLAVVVDAAWVAALTLLVLQLGFLLPPLGYAVLMGRSSVADPPSLAALSRVLAPQLGARLLLIGALFFWPHLLHWNDEVVPQTATQSNAEAERLMDEAYRRQRAADAASTPAPDTAER
ncbi:MAG: TRAP transporter large permease subunit [Pseudomonadota bacterium]|nr:TRAP transporter large permease subunit [Pseudomonadota bacterium]